ncbi:molybdate/tungstate transport system substrate-binding protein [Thermodesulfitimonas autotrophica]|uniref:Molybdate/tungstate transport system substrate-binding protein n=1 Tax=Thermodesulfitimonas autotrophica TaxID=1894989 RepID=A0A3N5AWN9_9THEO|nr:tungstate ABC transporter substrate-binding protein WtpA [Thermodesulfitimonas autotrophica]RPF49429.1 molybdate/tungstate transport system substrate-binding protein [Thermodesulfitimonas autotrophica]
MRFWRRFLTILAAALLLALTAGCGGKNTGSMHQPATKPAPKETLKGKVVIFHAGSLTVPLDKMAKEFERLHPGVKIEREASGSRTAARKVTDLHRPCDIVAAADYTVIDDLLYPTYTDHNVLFARNELVIMYTPQSKYAGEINSKNWYKILLRPGVNYGRSDENADPCGYRTLMCWQLAAKYYRDPGLYEKLNRGCPPRNIRPKEVDLISLLETKTLDYVFIYRSVAEQHKLPYVTLPPELNLSDIRYASFYKEAAVRVKGKKPGEMVTYSGKPIVYGVALLKNAPNREAATAFLKFMIDRNQGLRILKECGQPVFDPPLYKGTLPPELKEAALKPAA